MHSLNEQQLNDFFQAALVEAFAEPIDINSYQLTSGGCINNTAIIRTNKGDYFIKWLPGESLDFFEKEALGLEALLSTRAVNCPRPIKASKTRDSAFLLMEAISAAAPSTSSWTTLGKQLALLHEVSAPGFGFKHDNYIGSLPQDNTKHSSWSEFFIHCRLVPQLRLAEQKGLIDIQIRERFDILFSRLEDLFPKEPPALVHGDLWSGNVMFEMAQSGHSRPYIIDPAVHFAHREVELAFTTMFGGFGEGFYEGYQEVSPLEPGFEERIPLYNLYPYLVHVNLFGRSYLGGVVSTLDHFV